MHVLSFEIVQARGVEIVAVVDRRGYEMVDVGEGRVACWISHAARPYRVALYCAAALLVLPPRRSLPIVATTALAGAIGHALKLGVPRERPNVARFSPLGGQSFPSTHTALMTAFALSLAGARSARGAKRALGYAGAVAIGLAVGASRIRRRAHWPTDVIAGFGVGVFAFALVRLTRSA